MNDPKSREDAELEARLAEAARVAEDGDEERALGLLLELEKEHTEDPVLLAMIGALAAHLGASGIAADFFRRCLEQNPTDPHLLVTAGAGLAASGDPAAEPALRLAALTAPDLPVARMQFGAFLARTGLLEQAIEELLVARSLDPDDPQIRRELGSAYVLNRQIPEALEELETAAESDAEDGEVRLLLGLLLINEGETERAAEELHPLGEVLANDGEAQLLFALLFDLQGWEEEAWLALSRAESASDAAPPAAVQEVEDAIETGESAVRSLLVEGLAPVALRDRLYPA